MLKKIALLAALTIIFSAAQCFAKNAAPIYDNDEKNFVTAFNATAKKLTEGNEDGIKFFGLNTQIQFQEDRDNEDFYTAQSDPAEIGTVAVFVKRKPENIYDIAFISKTSDDATAALMTALVVLGFTEQEISSINVTNAEATVWFAAMKRDVTIKSGISNGKFIVSLEASTRD